MAQKRIDQRLVVAFAKAASTGILLVLAVGALMLSGCGGGSSDASSAEGSSSTSPAASGESESGGADSSASGSSAAAAAGTGPDSGAASVPGATGGAAAGDGGPSAGAKRGPPVPQPTGEEEPGITPEQRRQATVASMSLESPSSQASSGGPQMLPAEYTCDGKGTSPALRWQGVPQGTDELVLFAMNVQPVNEKLFFDWAVAGLNPELEEIEAGKLPKGAVVGRNSFGKLGYEICPESGETYMFALFALPQKLSPGQGFDPLALRKAATEASGNVGLVALSYARG